MFTTLFITHGDLFHTSKQFLLFTSSGSTKLKLVMALAAPQEQTTDHFPSPLRPFRGQPFESGRGVAPTFNLSLNISPPGYFWECCFPFAREPPFQGLLGNTVKMFLQNVANPSLLSPTDWNLNRYLTRSFHRCSFVTLSVICYILSQSTNRPQFGVVCTLIDNDIRHHSGQMKRFSQCVAIA